MPTNIASNQSENTPDLSQAARQDWLSILTRMELADLKHFYEALAEKPEYVHERVPQSGMIMSQGRAGGTGARFNLGHVSVTRAAIRLKSGEQGIGYCLGIDEEKVELIALFDALLQTGQHAHLMTHVIEPARIQQQQSRINTSRKSASSLVDFFTLVRGENADSNMRK